MRQADESKEIDPARCLSAAEIVANRDSDMTLISYHGYSNHNQLLCQCRVSLKSPAAN